jgi:hypothetical protein
MLKISYTLLMVLFLFSGAFASDKTGDNVKALMASKWIGKYKQLKKDIENKAATVKDMDQITDEDYDALRKSYSETSRRLEGWLLNLEATLEKGDASDVVFFSNGLLNPVLENELREICTFYSNEFSTLYEEVTGIKSRSIFSLNDGNDGNRTIPPTNIVWKFEHDELVSGLQPLRPLDWNSVN